MSNIQLIGMINAKIDLNTIGQANGVCPLNENTEIDPKYLINTLENKQNLITSPIQNDFVFTDSTGQTIDSGLSFSTNPTTNTNTQILSSAATQTQINNALSSVLKLKGNWNATTNSPTLIAGIGNQGDSYYVNVGGSQSLPSGTLTLYNIGDIIYYAANNIWNKIDNYQDVISVFGRTGVITSQSGDYTISQITNGLSNQLLNDNIYIGNSLNVAAPVSLSGDISLSNAGLTTIQPNVVNNTKLSQSSANTWKGNNTSSTANITDNTLNTLSESVSNILTITGTNNLLNSGTIQVNQSNTSTNGYLSNTDWNTFNNKQNSITSSTATVSSPLTITGTNNVLSATSIGINQSNTSQSGYLSSSDWNTFNNKLSNTLTNNNIFIGNSSNQAISNSITGDLSITNTGVSTIGSSTITANTNAKWDTNGNLNANNYLTPINTTSSSGTITLTVSSDYIQRFTSSATVLLPSNPSVGMSFLFMNETSGNTVAIDDSSSTNLYFLPDKSDILLTNTVSSTTGTWHIQEGFIPTSLFSGNILIGNSSNVATSQTMSGSATISNTGNLSINNNVITNAKLSQSGANTWKGNNTSSTANITDNNSSSLSEATSSVLTITGTNNLLNSGTIQVKQSSSSQSGYLSSTDWTTFNNKQNSITNLSTSFSSPVSLTINTSVQAISGMTLTLTTGTWLVQYSIIGYIALTSTSAGYSILTILYNSTSSSNVSSGYSQAANGYGTNSIISGNASASCIITVSGSNTFLIQFQLSSAANISTYQALYGSMTAVKIA